MPAKPNLFRELSSTAVLFARYGHRNSWSNAAARSSQRPQRRLLLERPQRTESRPPNLEPQARPSPLSPAQEEMLRELLRQTGPVLADHLDGRVARALLDRGLIEDSDGWVTPTQTGRGYLNAHLQRRRKRDSSPVSARSEALLRAVEQLEVAIPNNAELTLAGHPACADDVLSALRRGAREMVARAAGPPGNR